MAQRTLYLSAVADTSWDTAGNWFSDTFGGTPAPGGKAINGDIVFSDGTIDTPPAAPVALFSFDNSAIADGNNDALGSQTDNISIQENGSLNYFAGYWKTALISGVTASLFTTPGGLELLCDIAGANVTLMDNSGGGIYVDSATISSGSLSVQENAGFAQFNMAVAGGSVILGDNVAWQTVNVTGGKVQCNTIIDSIAGNPFTISNASISFDGGTSWMSSSTLFPPANKVAIKTYTRDASGNPVAGTLPVGFKTILFPMPM